MAKKICAIIARDFEKGRDFYDLLWYLSRNVEPNFNLLNNSIMQISEELPKLDKENWESKLLDLLKEVNFEKIRDDVINLLEIQDEAEMLNIETFKEILEK